MLWLVDFCRDSFCQPDSVDSITDALGDAGEAIGNAAQDGFNALDEATGGALGDAGEAIGNAAQDVFNALDEATGGALSDAGEAIGDAAQDGFNALDTDGEGAPAEESDGSFMTGGITALAFTIMFAFLS